MPIRLATLVVALSVVWMCAGCGGGGSNAQATRAFPGEAVSSASAPSQLDFAAQPVDTVVHQPLPPVEVAVLDSQGTQTLFNPVVHISLGDNPGDGTLSGTLTVTAVNGIATFSDLAIDAPGSGYTLVATSTNLEGATSFGFNVTESGPPAQLVFIAEPPETAAGAVIAPPVQVAVQDAFGHVGGDAVTGVTISLVSADPEAVLGGTLSVNTVDGVATFGDLTVDRAGSYALQVTTAAGLSAASASFQVP